MNSFYKTSFLVQFLLPVFLTINLPTIEAQQNTVLIILDDLSPDYFSFYNEATDTAHAPTTHSLARSGIKFTNVWSAPVCSPARASLLTGQYPFRTGIGGVITSPASTQIDTSETSIAKLLKYDAPNSYNTACIGKWHLNVNQPAKRLYPNKLGFDVYSGNFNGAINNYYNYPRVKNGILDTVTTYATSQTINDAIAWMDSMNTQKPFFLWVAFNAPHTPYHVPPATLCDTAGLFGTNADITNNPKKYFKAAIEACDTEIGRLLAYLTMKQVLDSTNIIIIGDNGNQNQVAQISNPSKAKGTLYDYGVRVPMIISGPSVVNGGRSSDALINVVDLFATIIEMCGFTNWKNAIPNMDKIDSKSFLPIIRNQGLNERTWIFAETFNNPATMDDGKTIRNQNYHLLRFDNGNEEFYNQSIDFEENNNLLMDTSSMSPIDWTNYQLLCDSLSSLTGMAGCQSNSLEENGVKSNFIIFPNPNHDALNIDFGNIYTEITISIKNMLGQEIENKVFHKSKQVQINIPGKGGIYFIDISADNNRIIQKIIKE